MDIGFFLDNRHVRGTDFRRPWEGNPGTGAVEYLHAALPYFIAHYGDGAVRTRIFASDTAMLPPDVPAHPVQTITDAARQAKAAGVDYLVFRPRMSEEDGILDVLDELQLPSIGRAALTPHPDHVRRMAKCGAFKALVCVGREQYDYLMDTPLHNKLAYIDNGVQVSSCLQDPAPAKGPRLVVYMGALVLQKGFHVLAEAWPKVLQRIPDARLSVIGSLTMYNESAQLGPLGDADEHYERTHIMQYLCGPDGALHPSVTFHGRMGREKYEILQRALVGVANPTGQTETCCVSAVEMAACKTAVVSGAYYALLDTVRHNETGLLGRSGGDLAANICRLLEDPDRAIAMGKAGHRRAMEQYDFSVVVPRWIDLFGHLSRHSIPVPAGRTKNLSRHLKAVRLVNRFFQKCIGSVLQWPSLQEVTHFAQRLRAK